MESTGTTDLAFQAGKLLHHALHPRLLPAQDDEYRTLVARYRSDSQFQNAVDALLSSLGLTITQANPLGFYLASASDSIFAYGLADFRREPGMSDANTILGRTLYGLVFIGIAAYFYPHEQHLLEERHPQANAVQIDAFIRTLCEEIAKQHPTDQEAGTDDEPVWRFYLRQKETSQGKDERKGQKGTLRAVEKTLDWMAEQGLVRRSTDGRGVQVYQPLDRFRRQIANFAGEELFGALSQAGRQAQ